MRFTDGVITELTLKGIRDTKLTVYANNQDISVSLAENECKTIIKDGVII